MPVRNAIARWRTRTGLVVLACLMLAAPVAAESRDEWQQPDRVLSDLNLKAGWTVADVGCGPGYLTFRLAKAVGETGKVLAQDVDKGALKTVADKARKEHVENVETVTGDGADTKLKAASLDAALMCDVIHEVPDAQKAPLIKSVAEAVKPGGYFFFIDYRKSHDVKFDPYEKLIPHDDLVKLATDAGLVLDAEFHYLKYQVFFRFRKPVKP